MNNYFARLTFPQQLIYWVIGIAIAFPLLYILFNPDNGMLLMTLASFILYERSYDYWGVINEEWSLWQRVGATFLTGIAVITAAFALAYLWLWPVCSWFFLREIEVRFLNHDIYNGLALCYQRAPEIGSFFFTWLIGVGLVPIFYLVYQFGRGLWLLGRKLVGR